MNEKLSEESSGETPVLPQPDIAADWQMVAEIERETTGFWRCLEQQQQHLQSTWVLS